MRHPTLRRHTHQAPRTAGRGPIAPSALRGPLWQAARAARRAVRIQAGRRARRGVPPCSHRAADGPATLHRQRIEHRMARRGACARRGVLRCGRREVGGPTAPPGRRAGHGAQRRGRLCRTAHAHPSLCRRRLGSTAAPLACGSPVAIACHSRHALCRGRARPLLARQLAGARALGHRSCGGRAGASQARLFRWPYAGR